jgi:hypothetical protein
MSSEPLHFQPTFEVSNRRKRVLVTAFNAHEAREIAMLAWNLHSVRDMRSVKVRCVTKERKETNNG